MCLELKADELGGKGCPGDGSCCGTCLDWGPPSRSVVSQVKKSTLPQVSQNFKVEWLTAPLLEAAFD